VAASSRSLPDQELYHYTPSDIFARTLLRRPDLAYKVRRLDIVTAKYDKDSSELYVKSDEDDNATRVIQQIGQ
jgi:hypothetical protein